ncbi:GH39 family glycosyl hydrolase [Granulicella sibirica]|uniref:Beta-xylosidase n=1 Tax=Granulicella sibirica TaxID=2479048 RepID=A0A4Q0T9I6_9BACT|nr:glycoside hydrolase [Granulicella sibirica]RXH58709.1 Beta-xylosidase [Granulicella sibirica]
MAPLRVFLAAVLVFHGILHGQTRQISADAAHPAGAHSGVPLFCVGAGRASEALYPEWQAQLATLQREIGFHYLRFHGILSDEMGLYKEDPNGNPVYDFTKVDKVYDILLARHIKPFVELTFMPKALASGTHTIFWYSANVTPPKDMQKWQALIRELTKHWIARYGLPEVQSWYFEVWNEPDYPSFFFGTIQQYFDLYRATATTLKEVCPACRVGGPATSNPSDTRFLTFLNASHTPIDFYSTHTYGVLKLGTDAQGRIGSALDPSPDSVTRHLRALREQIDRSANPQLPIHLTEWSSSYLPDDFFHDQYGSASFILDHVRRGSAYTASMSYWIFTDIFEERGPQTKPFYGGFGLFNLEGIRKPSFFAYKYLAQLGPTDLATTDPANQSWITITPGAEQPSVQALFWDYTPISPPSGQIDQTFYKKEIPAPPVAPIDLTLEHLASGLYTVTVYRTGLDHNDPFTAYLRMGSPATLTPSQRDELQTKAAGAPIETRAITIKDGTFHQQFPMNQNDVYFVTLTPAR